MKEEAKFPEVNQAPPDLDLKYNVTSHEIIGKANEMKYSESILGKKPQAKIDSPKADTERNQKNQSFSSSRSINTMNKSLSSGSAESIFSVSKLDTPYTEDTC